jgi:hypothetical protein
MPSRSRSAWSAFLTSGQLSALLRSPSPSAVGVAGVADLVAVEVGLVGVGDVGAVVEAEAQPSPSRSDVNAASKRPPAPS